MTEQTSIWQHDLQSVQFAELCNALYERELLLLAGANSSLSSLPGRLKSLPYYIKATALCMTQVSSPLDLDTQNATWSTKQSSKLPLMNQNHEDILLWYQQCKLVPGLVVPIALETHIVLDSVVRVDLEKQRFRTNLLGWFALDRYEIIEDVSKPNFQLLKPNKRVMMAACAGHTWKNNQRALPTIPSLRELRLSCDINWKNLKKPIIAL